MKAYTQIQQWARARSPRLLSVPQRRKLGGTSACVRSTAAADRAPRAAGHNDAHPVRMRFAPTWDYMDNMGRFVLIVRFYEHFPRK